MRGGEGERIDHERERERERGVSRALNGLREVTFNKSSTVNPPRERYFRETLPLSGEIT